MESIRLNSHAKINLSLRITGRRPDGYHEIVSFMQGTGICDTVSLRLCPENGTKYNLPHCTINGIVVYLCTDAKTIPTDMSNLAFRGIKAFADSYPDPDELKYKTGGGLLIDLQKRLPVAAGIAGGSGNAAVCMLGLNALLGDPFTLRELMDIGTAVGADVPFSIFMNAFRNRDALAGLGGLEEASDSAWTSGIGEIVEAAEAVPAYVVLANPGTPVSTKSAYEAMDRIGYDAEEESYRTLYVNDLEKYTLQAEPRADALKKLMQSELDADVVLMSGSGPTIAAYFSDMASAERAAKRLSELTESDKSIKVWVTDSGCI